MDAITWVSKNKNRLVHADSGATCKSSFVVMSKGQIHIAHCSKLGIDSLFLSVVPKPTDSQYHDLTGQRLSSSRKLSLEEGWRMVPNRLQQLRMMLSPTQLTTPGNSPL